MTETTTQNARSAAQKFRKALDRFMASPPETTTELRDPSYPGLSVRVGARGKPTWTYRYRRDGEQLRERLGAFPEVSIADAHTKVEAAQRRLKAGEPPFPREEAPAEARTVAAVAAIFDKEHSARLRTGAEQRRLLERGFLCKYGSRPIASITRRDVRDALTRLRDQARETGATRVLNAAASRALRQAEAAERERAQAEDRRPDLARARASARDKVKAARTAAKSAADAVALTGGVESNRLRAALSKFFGWCVEQDYLAVNPVTGLKKLVKVEARDRVLDDAEIAAIWKACDRGSSLDDVTKLLFLTGRRLNEVAGMRWSELDLEAGEWRLPAARAKNNAVAVTPLSSTARTILEGRDRIERCDFVFSTTGKSAVSGFGKHKRALDERAMLAEPWRMHDIRRTVATNLQRLGVHLEVTEAVLGHVSGSKAGIVGVYQRYDWADEKRIALRRWADRLDDIVAGRTSNVVTLGTAPGAAAQ